QGREADGSREQHRDEPALGRGRLTRSRNRRVCDEGRPALAAEALAGLVRGAAGRAGGREGPSAFRAELAPLPVLGPAARTEHWLFRSLVRQQSASSAALEVLELPLDPGCDVVLANVGADRLEPLTPLGRRHRQRSVNRLRLSG